MATFSDATGRVWSVAITYATVKRIRLATGVKVGELSQSAWEPLARFLESDDLFADVLYETVRPQAESCGVNSEQFADLLNGDVAEDARKAWAAAYVDFCPRHQRPLLMAMLKQGEADMIAAAAEATQILSTISSTSAVHSPESADSNQTTEPSAN